MDQDQIKSLMARNERAHEQAAAFFRGELITRSALVTEDIYWQAVYLCDDLNQLDLTAIIRETEE